MTTMPRYDTCLDDGHVQALDPLRATRLLPALCAMNAAADVDALIATACSLVPSAEEIAVFSPMDCLAAMRDLGMFVGSIKRHGAEPVDAVPGLEPGLLELGARTGMIPRDTVHHYIRWNPTGVRERLYTGERMERMLVLSVRVSLPKLTSAVDVCRRMVDLDPVDLEFMVAATELVGLLRSMEDSIDIVRANVTPEFFARTMRPYFEQVRVGGDTYLGPAAAHVPLSLIDLALWASDHADDAYGEFWRESAKYGVPPWQDLYRRWAAGPSMATRLITALRQAGDGGVPPELHAGAEAVCRALRSLVAFRGKHSAVARKAYAEPVRLYPLGSGGGSVELLENITARTRENAALVRALLLRTAERATHAASPQTRKGTSDLPVRRQPLTKTAGA